MIYILRMTKSTNRTTRADVLIELDNPTVEELRDKLAELLGQGVVSCLMIRDDGTLVFYPHDLCRYFSARLKEV